MIMLYSGNKECTGTYVSNSKAVLSYAGQRRVIFSVEILNNFVLRVLFWSICTECENICKPSFEQRKLATYCKQLQRRT